MSGTGSYRPSSADLDIPTHPDQLTPEWFTNALRTVGLLGDEARVTTISSRPLGEDSGIAGVLRQVTLAYSPARPSKSPQTLVVKMPQPQLRALVGSTEVLFYTHIAPLVPLRVPACYLARSGDDGQWVLLLEDLTGLAVVDPLEGLDERRSVLALRSLAGMHAKWWGRPDLLVPPLAPFRDRLDRFSGIVRESAPAFWKRVDQTLSSDLRRVLRTLVDRHDELLANYLDSTPLTLIHGDFAAQNCLFGDGVTTPDMVLLDWQIVSVAGVGLDLAQFLSTSLTVEQRRSTERTLLAEYSSALNDEGIHIDSQALFDGYRVGLLYRLCRPVMIIARARTPLALEVGFRNLERCGAAVLDLDCEELLTTRGAPW